MASLCSKCDNYKPGKFTKNHYCAVDRYAVLHLYTCQNFEPLKIKEVV